MRLRAQSKSSAEHNWLATCETADWAVCATFQTRFMVPMQAQARKRAFHEPAGEDAGAPRDGWAQVPMHAPMRKEALHELGHDRAQNAPHFPLQDGEIE